MRAGSSGNVIVGGGAGEVFATGAAFFCADLPEPRALAALANIAEIFERDGGEEGRGVLVLDLAGAGAGVFDAALAAGVGEGTGEGGADRIIPPAPVEGDPASTGAADTAKRKDTQ
jgi:hypothetical protein